MGNPPDFGILSEISQPFEFGTARLVCHWLLPRDSIPLYQKRIEKSV